MNSDKKYIVILLTTTLISIGIMIYFTNVQSYLADNYFTVEKDSSFINNDNLNLQEKLEEDSVQDIEEGNDTLLKEENIIDEPLNDNVDKQDKEALDNTEQEKNNDYISKDSVDIQILEEKSVTVFKVDKNNIVSEISNKDKLKLLKMANSLSVNDYKTLLEHVKRSDELLAAMDIFRLLKEKLSVNDYEKLTKILLPYIDIDMIENKINEK